MLQHHERAASWHAARSTVATPSTRPPSADARTRPPPTPLSLAHASPAHPPPLSLHPRSVPTTTLPSSPLISLCSRSVPPAMRSMPLLLRFEALCVQKFSLRRRPPLGFEPEVAHRGRCCFRCAKSANISGGAARACESYGRQPFPCLGSVFDYFSL